MARAGDIILEINRPQYVSVPEGFISSLAWSVHEWDRPQESSKPLGLIYKRTAKSEKKSPNFELLETAPSGEQFASFGLALKDEGLGYEAMSTQLISEAVVNSVTGVQAEKSTLQAASPITPGFALLQNMRGIQGAKNPPDLAGILEAIYAYGKEPSDAVTDGVAEHWYRAASRRCSQDPLLRAMDSAVRHKLLGHNLRAITPETPNAPICIPNSPFTWFARTWEKLTSDEWVEAMPARVWTDWATTVLRLGLGMGFLWEATWYESLARRILSNESFARDEAIAQMPQTLPWQSQRASQSVRDVASILLWRVHRGGGIRKVLTEWLDERGDLDEEFETALSGMRTDDKLLNDLTSVIGGQHKTSVNTWEAIKYALMTRDVAGPFADYYGLLKSSGRYLTVDPGTEWIAVVASLSCDKPRGSANVGELMSNLNELGMQPELADIVGLLERAGLARGSADADQGVQIQSAF